MVDRARAVGKLISPLSKVIEESRRLPPEVVRALTDAGLFKVVVSRALGGEGASALTLLGVIEEVARADGSAGWCTMVGATSGLMSAFLEESVAREIYSPADAITCGVTAPMGRAIPVDGGFRVTGRWAFASGCEHSPWRMVGTLVAQDPPERLPSGAPDVRCVLLRAEDTEVIDTWTTHGLRGTGSHDLGVKDVFVPASRTFSLFSTPMRQSEPIHRMPFLGVLASGVAAVSLGIARAAIDEFVTLARTKSSLGSKRGIAHRELVQMAVVQAEAKVRSARAFLHERIEAADAETAGGEPPSLPTRALLRVAACNAATESAAAVDLVYTAAGGTSIYATSPLQRCFRDVHVATQHVMVASSAATLAGRVLLGVESDTSTL